MRSIILAYAWSIPLAVIAFMSSRGVDGNLGLFALGFGLVGLAYIVHNLASSEGVSLHHLGHAVVFAVVVATASLLDGKLEEMAGMLYLMMPAASLVIVAVAVVGLWIKKRVSGTADEGVY